MPTKDPGEAESWGSSPPSDNQPGTSREVEEDRPAPETRGAVPAPPPAVISYSAELFRTRRDIRWFQIPLSSLRRPTAGLFSFSFQSSLQEYQRLRRTKRLKVGRPFSVLPLPSLSAVLVDSCRKASHRRVSTQTKGPMQGWAKEAKQARGPGASPEQKLPWEEIASLVLQDDFANLTEESLCPGGVIPSFWPSGLQRGSCAHSGHFR